MVYEKKTVSKSSSVEGLYLESEGGFRQGNRKAGTVFGIGDIEPAAHLFLDDLFGHIQADTCTFSGIFGREIGVEDFIQKGS